MLSVAMLFGDVGSEVYEVVTSMVSAMAEYNAPAFEKTLAKDMAGREKFMRDVRAMLDRAEVTSSVAPIQDEGDERRHTAVVDWSLQLKQRGTGEQIVQRRETVTVQFERDGKRWVVTSIAPAALFSPPDFR